MPLKLSQADVERLVRDQTADGRAEAATKIAAGFGAGTLNDAERQIAEDIFRLMVNDAEERVRTALSVNLKAAPDLPHDIARDLARDVSDAVALPILSFSTVLTDDDLIEIVQTQASERQQAIARRETVSAGVADAIVEHGDQRSVAALVANEGATIADAAMHRVVDRYGTVPGVQVPLVQRGRLPVAVAERLVALVSERLREHLVTHHELPAAVATDLVLESRERATLSIVGADAPKQDVADLVKQLAANGRLTPSIILRALCFGDMAFFEAAMARKAGLSLHNTRLLIHDDGPLGLRSVYDRACLPAALYPAFRVACDVNREGETERFDDVPGATARRTLERVLTHFEDIEDQHNVEDIDYLLRRLKRMAATAGSRAA